MKAEELVKYPSVANWLARLSFRHSGSVKTRHGYLHALNLFCRSIGKNPDELLALGKEDVEAVETLVMQSFNKAQEEGKKRGTVVFYYMVVRSFFRHNKVKFTDISPESWTETESRPLSKEEITRLIDVADIRIKAFVTVMKDSGLAPVDILLMTYGQVKAGLETNNVPVSFTILRQKTKVKFTAFLGPDAILRLKQYLDARRRGTKTISPETFTDSTRLFVTEDNRKVPASYETIRIQFDIACKKAAIKARLYDIRKFFQTQLVLASVNEKLIEYWMGHKLPGQKIAYLVPTVQEQAVVYMHAYPRLSLTETEPIGAAKQQWKAQLIASLRLNPSLTSTQVDMISKELDKFRDLSEVDWDTIKAVAEGAK